MAQADKLNPRHTIIFGTAAGAAMIALSFLLENSFRWFMLTAFKVTLDGALLPSALGALVLVLPVTGAVMLIRQHKGRETTATVLLLTVAIACTATAYLLRGAVYASETRRLVFDELRIARTFVTAEAILATWLPFLLASSGLFVLACTMILWRPRIVGAAHKIVQALSRYPADPQLRWWCWLLGLAAAARIAWILLVPARPVGDFAAYDGHALRLAEGLGYVSDRGELTAYWPVGYPMFLAGLYKLFGHSLLAAKTAGTLLGLATVALTYLLGRLCAGERAGRIAGLIVALIPGQAVYANLLATETLFTPLALGAVYLIIRSNPGLRAYLVAGVLTGAAALVRPLALAFPVVFFVYFLASRQKPRLAFIRIALIVAGSLAVLSPWMWRNYRVFGQVVVVSTNGGLNFFLGNNPDTAKSPFYTAAAPKLTGQTELERNAEGYARGLKFIARNPGTFVTLGVRKVYRLYSSDVMPMNWSFCTVRGRDSLQIIAVYMAQAAYILVMAAAAAGLL